MNKILKYIFVLSWSLMFVYIFSTNFKYESPKKIKDKTNKIDTIIIYKNKCDSINVDSLLKHRNTKKLKNNTKKRKNKHLNLRWIYMEKWHKKTKKV